MFTGLERFLTVANLIDALQHNAIMIKNNLRQGINEYVALGFDESQVICPNSLPITG